MAYGIGVDIGATHATAAVWREGGPGPEDVRLGTATRSVPAAVGVAEDGTLVVGEDARDLAATAPHRVAADLPSRVGDPVPVYLGSRAVRAEALLAGLVRWVVDRVAVVEGPAVAGVAVCHPAAWGPHRVDALRSALAQVGLPDATLVSTPLATVAGCADVTDLPAGAFVAVADVGGEKTEAAVVRRLDSGAHALVRRSVTSRRIGGEDLAESVFHRVLEGGDATLDGLRAQGAPERAVARLRRTATVATRRLSTDPEAEVRVALAGLDRRVRVVRPEFEELVGDRVRDVAEVVDKAVADAGVSVEDLEEVLLVGGAAQTPLVVEAVSDLLDRPVLVVADPAHAGALGAAAVAHRPAGLFAEEPVAEPVASEALGVAHPGPAPVGVVRPRGKDRALVLARRGASVASVAAAAAMAVVLTAVAVQAPENEAALRAASSSAGGGPAALASTEAWTPGSVGDPDTSWLRSPQVDATDGPRDGRSAGTASATPVPALTPGQALLAAPRPTVPSAPRPEEVTQGSEPALEAEADEPEAAEAETEGPEADEPGPAPVDPIPDPTPDPATGDPTPDATPDPAPVDPTPDPAPDPATGDPTPDPTASATQPAETSTPDPTSSPTQHAAPTPDPAVSPDPVTT